MNYGTPTATLAAASGASTAELMHRLGHASPAAALIYQHATTHRDAEIARALDALVTARLPSPAPLKPQVRGPTA